MGTGSVLVFRRGDGDLNSVGPLRVRLAVSKGPNSVGVSFCSLEDGTRPTFHKVELGFRTMDKVHESCECCSVSSEHFGHCLHKAEPFL
jgi:hypothetical protein